MSTSPDLPTMYLLLRQARAPALLSLGLLLVALLLLGLMSRSASAVTVLLLLSVLSGLVQGWYAVRIGLDAALLRMLCREGLHGEAAARRVDAALRAAGLR
ncbi:MAG: hypothetical protein QM581_03125, partial [Pseudomonas sp.]